MPESTDYELFQPQGAAPIKAWVRGVPVEVEAMAQLENVARLPFIHRWLAVMPDVHVGMGATVGTVIATRGAVVPAAVGVDIGCGIMAVKTSLKAGDLPDDLKSIRAAIEKAVPVGRTNQGGRGDRGAWHDVPAAQKGAWAQIEPEYERIVAKHPRASHPRPDHQLGTLGTGNHFIEVCLDEPDGAVWFLLHSGSRGVGNRFGTYFIELARNDLARARHNLPDKDLAYLTEGTQHFDDYVEAVGWAQEYAALNRRLMMRQVIDAVARTKGVHRFTADLVVVNCHHNYVAREEHYGESVLVTRKGAVRAGAGELGIIPGSMGARSYIVRGKGNPESFESCSHGAGRTMSRTEAKRRFTLADHVKATLGIECRKDQAVLDETPQAYKSIDAVMTAQKDLVEVVTALRQIICVKG